MKTAIAGAVLTVLSLSLPAVAATTTKYQFKGENASAYFYQSDGCNSTTVSVYAFTKRTKDGPGAPTEQMGADLYYDNYNSCTGTYSSSGSGSSPNATFTIDNKLSSATLKGTFAVYDYSSGTTKTADVDLTWTGTNVTSGQNDYTYQTPTSIRRYRSNGSYSQAQATGSVTVDGINLINNPSNSYGYLDSSKYGTFERTTR